MSRKRPQEEFNESLSGRFKRWLDGEKDPFVGTLEMKPPAPGAGARGAVWSLRL